MQNVDIENNDFYEKKWGEQWNIAREHYGPIFFHRKRLIQRIIENNSLSGKVLDVGCGDGSVLSLFHGDKNELYGCDVSEKAIQLAKLKFGNIATFTIGDITNLSSLPGGKFDVLICSEVLEHIEKDESALKNLYHKLKKGGYLIITVPHMEKYWTRRDASDGHLRRYEKEEIEKKVTKTGFIVCKNRSWGYPLLHLYCSFALANVQEQTVMEMVKIPKFKQFFSIVLRMIFYLDDLFIQSSRGRNLFLLAKKTV